MQRKHTIWLCLLAALRCDAAIYQWIDSTGTVQFSDRPPAERVEVIERRDIEAAAVAPPPQPLPKRIAAPAKAKTGSPRKTHSRTAGISEREQARQHCEKLRRRIDTTQSQLRAGYSARRGITLNERLRADRNTLFHDCRY
jgi:hypothetical protein